MMTPEKLRTEYYELLERKAAINVEIIEAQHLIQELLAERVEVEKQIQEKLREMAK